MPNKMSCTRGQSTPWSEYSGSIRKLWGENTTSWVHNNEKETKTDGKRGWGSCSPFVFSWLFTLSSLLPLACACMLVCCFGLLLLKIIALVNLLHCRKGASAVCSFFCGNKNTFIVWSIQGLLWLSRLLSGEHILPFPILESCELLKANTAIGP